MTNSFYCPFAKALLNSHSRCQFAESFHIAERHGIQCKQHVAHARCTSLATQLHEQSRFALGVTQLPRQMTSNMELRIQCGGINGIASCIDEPKPDSPLEIYSLITAAVEQFGNIEALPYSRIAQAISQWKPKRRARHKRD